MARNPRSTASIAGHPLHPMMVGFPIAFFVAAFVCDLIYASSGNAMWATGALWLIGFGLITAAIAAVLGLIDFLGDHRIRALNDVWWHAGTNVAVVLIQLVNWYVRYTQPAENVATMGLILSLVTVVLLLFSGWKGGEMVYRSRVGVADDPDRIQAHPGGEPARDTGRRAA